MERQSTMDNEAEGEREEKRRPEEKKKRRDREKGVICMRLRFDKRLTLRERRGNFNL